MSGGHFNYDQNRIEYVASGIDELIATNDSDEVNEYGDVIGYHFPPDILAKFDETRKVLRLAEAMAQRVDLLVSGDSGEDSFMEGWQEEVEPLR